MHSPPVLRDFSAGFASPVGTAPEGAQPDDYRGFMSNERQSPPAVPAETAPPAVVPGFLPSHPTLDRTTTLRLIWPQWQGAGYDNAGLLAPELPVQVARRGYVAGARSTKIGRASCRERV